MEALRLVAKYVALGYPDDLPAYGDGNTLSAYLMASKESGINVNTIRTRTGMAKDRLGISPQAMIEAAVREDDDRPCPIRLLDNHAVENLRHIARRRTKPAVFMVRPEPFAVAFVGDPHLTNEGCNLAALRADLELLAHSGVDAVEMGDMLDNFHRNAKLAAKEAHNRMSIRDGLSLAEWMVAESGVRWKAILLGNHDLWLSDEGVALIGEWARRAKSRLFNWNAHLIYRWGDGPDEKHWINAAHDFKGSSIYNPLHGNAKMAIWDGRADTYVAAHRHNHADAKMPNGWRGKTYQLVRVRGYKDYDSYSAGRAQFPDHEGMEGRSALVVINPLSHTHDGRQRVFMDLADGLEYLGAIKRRAA